jgi:hypothetical protein
MFKQLFAKAAAKASLTNIGYDLRNLTRAFPNGDSFPKTLGTYFENAYLALDHGASKEDVLNKIRQSEAAKNGVLTSIVEGVLEMVLAVRSGDKSSLKDLNYKVTELLKSIDPDTELIKMAWTTPVMLRPSERQLIIEVGKDA